MIHTSDYWYDDEGNAHRVRIEKLIRSDTAAVMMTFEEVFQQLQRLIKNKAFRWSSTYEYDEIYQIASIALWKAFTQYDAVEHDVPFKAFAAKRIKYDIYDFHMKQRPKYFNKTSQVKSLCSLHDLVGDDGTELEELIGEQETFSQDTVEKIVMDKLFKKVTKQQLQDIQAYISGFQKKELAKTHQVKEQTVAARIQRSFIKFRALYIKEMIKCNA